MRQSLTFSKALFAIVFVVMPACRAPEKKTEVPVVRMATILGRITNPLANTLNKILPEHFPARIEVQKIENSGQYPRLIETGQIELAMIQTDLAYGAYTRGVGESSQPMKKLRGVGVLYTTPLHLLATKQSRITNLMDLRGKRVFVGNVEGMTEFTVKMTLEGIGLSFADMEIQHGRDEDIVPALSAGRFDAVFYRGNDPYPLIQEMMNVPGVSFVPISRAQIEGIRAHHAFLHSISIAAGTYGNHPEIETVGADMLLACRDDLPEELVYWITRTLFESLPALAESFPPLRQIDIEHVQASPVPLHVGAARFYRERELFP